jgi:hypothetical protein
MHIENKSDFIYNKCDDILEKKGDCYGNFKF